MVRFKNRYLLAELMWRDSKVDESIDESALTAVVRQAIQLNFGDHGLGSMQASVQVKYYNPYTNLCILRCERDDLDKVWCALTLVSDISMRKLLIRMLHVAGTVQACQAAAVQYDAAILQRVRLTAQQREQASRLGTKLGALEL